MICMKFTASCNLRTDLRICLATLRKSVRKFWFCKLVLTCVNLGVCLARALTIQCVHDFQVAFHFCFKASPGAKPFIWKIACNWFTCRFWFIWVWIKIIFILKASHKDSLWNGGERQLINGLLCNLCGRLYNTGLTLSNPLRPQFDIDLHLPNLPRNILGVEKIGSLTNISEPQQKINGIQASVN